MAKTPQNSAPRTRVSRTANTKSNSAKTTAAKATTTKTAPSKTTAAKSTSTAETVTSKADTSKSTTGKTPQTKLTQKPQIIDVSPKQVRTGKPESTGANPDGSLPVGDAVKVLEEARARPTRSLDDDPSFAKSPPPKKGFGILAILLAGATGGALTVLAGLAVLGSGVFRVDIGPMQNQLDEFQTELQGVSSQVKNVSGEINELKSVEPVQVSPDLSQPLNELESVVAQLGTKLTEFGASADQRSQLGENKLTDLDRSLAELSDGLTSQIDAMEALLNERLEDVGQRSEALAARHNALEASVTSGQAGDGPALAAIESKLQQLAAVQEQLNTQIKSQESAPRKEPTADGSAQMDSVFTAFKQAVIKAEKVNDVLIEQGAELAALSARADALEKDLLAQKQAAPATVVENANSAPVAGADVNYLYDSLTIALQRGVPFSALLRTVQTEFPEDYPYAQLADSAQNGIMPLDALANDIGVLRADISAKLSAAQARPQAPVAETDPAQSIWDRMVDNMSSLVTVREINPPTKDQISPLLQSLHVAEELVREGRVGDAIYHFEAMAQQATLVTLSGAESGRKIGDALAQWTDTLTQHSNANALLTTLSKARDAAWAQGAKP